MQQALEGREDVALLAILPGDPPELRRLRDALDVRVTLLSDPAWSTYRAYGFARGGFRNVWLSPSTWAAYARLVGRGRRLHLPRQDVYELGGDAIVDRHGVLEWAYRSRHPADRPPIGEIVRRLDDLS